MMRTISEKQFPPRGIVQEISNAKDAMISPEEMWEDAGEDYRKQTVARLYAAYQRHLRESNALDFDDIIYLTVELFRRQSISTVFPMYWWTSIRTRTMLSIS